VCVCVCVCLFSTEEHKHAEAVFCNKTLSGVLIFHVSLNSLIRQTLRMIRSSESTESGIFSAQNFSRTFSTFFSRARRAFSSPPPHCLPVARRASTSNSMCYNGGTTPLSVLVVGGGLFGVTAAYELAVRGHRVTVLERAGATHPHENAATCDISKMVRLAYGYDREYTRLMQECLPIWHQWNGTAVGRLVCARL
jgi:FAD dependent oxidoreductase